VIAAIGEPPIAVIKARPIVVFYFFTFLLTFWRVRTGAALRLEAVK
jgi:hypothetical protein